MTEKEMSRWLAHSFGVRTNICVPNLSWGMGFWEMDLAVCSKSGYLKEVEIKCSMADLRADKLKSKWTTQHYKDKFDEMVSAYYVAVPIELADKIQPDDLHLFAGIIVVDPNAKYWFERVKEIKPSTKKRGRKLTTDEQLQLARLGTMRYWGRKP